MPSEQERRYNFLVGMLPNAQRWAAQTGIPPSVYLAIMASESNFGAAPSYFGIKGTGPAGSANLDTHEVYGGNTEYINDAFRVYNSVDEAHADFIDLISGNQSADAMRRYGPAWEQYQKDGNWQALLQGINAGGYATDPNWATMIGGLTNTVQQIAPESAVGAAPAVESAATIAAGEGVALGTEGAAAPAGGSPLQAILDKMLSGFGLTAVEAGELAQLTQGAGVQIPAGASTEGLPEGYYWDPATGMPTQAQSLASFTPSQIGDMIRSGEITGEQGAILHGYLHGSGLSPARLQLEQDQLRAITPEVITDDKQGYTATQWKDIVAKDPSRTDEAVAAIKAMYPEDKYTQERIDLEVQNFLAAVKTSDPLASLAQEKQRLEAQGFRVYQNTDGTLKYYDAEGREFNIGIRNGEVVQQSGGVNPYARAMATQPSGGSDEPNLADTAAVQGGLDSMIAGFRAEHPELGGEYVPSFEELNQFYDQAPGRPLSSINVIPDETRSGNMAAFAATGSLLDSALRGKAGGGFQQTFATRAQALEDMIGNGTMTEDGFQRHNVLNNFERTLFEEGMPFNRETGAFQRNMGRDNATGETRYEDITGSDVQFKAQELRGGDPEVYAQRLATAQEQGASRGIQLSSSTRGFQFVGADGQVIPVGPQQGYDTAEQAWAAYSRWLLRQQEVELGRPKYGAIAQSAAQSRSTGFETPAYKPLQVTPRATTAAATAQPAPAAYKPLSFARTPNQETEILQPRRRVIDPAKALGMMAA